MRRDRQAHAPMLQRCSPVAGTACVCAAIAGLDGHAHPQRPPTLGAATRCVANSCLRLPEAGPTARQGADPSTALGNGQRAGAAAIFTKPIKADHCEPGRFGQHGAGGPDGALRTLPGARIGPAGRSSRPVWASLLVDNRGGVAAYSAPTRRSSLGRRLRCWCLWAPPCSSTSFTTACLAATGTRPSSQIALAHRWCCWCRPQLPVNSAELMAYDQAQPGQGRLHGSWGAGSYAWHLAGRGCPADKAQGRA